ncbi:MAG TPA: VWA domain-containing protein [Methylothermaceae bacterium]|nr:VWA domain-containing protein [Methylothermaceae bacterium]
MKRFGWRFWLYLAVIILLAGTLFQPRIVVSRSVHRYVFVLDITQSMNTRDYHLLCWPNDRLGFAKAVLEQAILALPCGSEAGLAIFTHKNAYLLLAPLEVCQHGAALRSALHAIDWRSAWAADSYIAYGLFDALRMAETLDADLVFLTDGQQIPDTVKSPAFQGKPGKVQGFIIGVGGLAPVPIPKLDLEGRPAGFWHRTDLPRQVHSPRFHRQSTHERSGLLLSHLDENRLRHLASLTGLNYHRLRDPEQLSNLLDLPYTAKKRPVTVDLRPWLGAAALMFAFISLV